jgi:hypothetical protein
VSKPHPPRKKVIFRKLRDVDHGALDASLQIALADVRHDPNACYNAADTESLVARYDSALQRTLDEHAPLREAVLTVKPRAPWYTTEIDDAKTSSTEVREEMASN